MMTDYSTSPHLIPACGGVSTMQQIYYHCGPPGWPGVAMLNLWYPPGSRIQCVVTIHGFLPNVMFHQPLPSRLLKAI